MPDVQASVGGHGGDAVITRPLHHSLPRRPARTSETTGPILFSVVPLGTDRERVIVGGGARGGLVTIAVRGVDHHTIERTFIFASHVDVVHRAIVGARALACGETFIAGRLESLNQGSFVHVTSRRADEPVLSFQRYVENVVRFGPPMHVRGDDELTALERALDWLRNQPQSDDARSAATTRRRRRSR